MLIQENKDFVYLDISKFKVEINFIKIKQYFCRILKYPLRIEVYVPSNVYVTISRILRETERKWNLVCGAGCGGMT